MCGILVISNFLVIKLNGESGFKNYNADLEYLREHIQIVEPTNLLKYFKSEETKDVKDFNKKTKCEQDLTIYKNAIMKQEKWALKSKK